MSELGVLSNGIQQLLPEEINSDSRRSIHQLITTEIKQVNFYKAKKGAHLGDHFHKKTTEYFFITKGAVMANGHLFSRHTLFVVKPNLKHKLECLTDVEFLTFLTNAYTKEDKDIYK